MADETLIAERELLPAHPDRHAAALEMSHVGVREPQIKLITERAPATGPFRPSTLAS